MNWFEKLFVLLSCAVNTFFFDGDPEESISARAWREDWPARKRIDKILGDHHCQRVFNSREKREKDRKPIDAKVTS